MSDAQLTGDERPFERVYTVNDYYDGPREGFADFLGAPHAYRSIFREALDDWDPDGRFELSPVSREVLDMALEEWGIWMRWSHAHQAGHTPVSTAPALPEDRARHDEIHPVVDCALRIDPAHRRIARGEFRRQDERQTPARDPYERWEVRWTPTE